MSCILSSIICLSVPTSHTCPYKQLIKALAELGRDAPFWQASNKTLETTVAQPEPLAVPLR